MGQWPTCNYHNEWYLLFVSVDGRSNQEEGFDHPSSSSDEESEDGGDDDDLDGGDDTLINIITKLKGAGTEWIVQLTQTFCGKKAVETTSSTNCHQLRTCWT